MQSDLLNQVLPKVLTLVSELDTPRPLAELSESPERTHEVIVSGAMTFSSCVPSDLNDKKPKSVQHCKRVGSILFFL